MQLLFEASIHNLADLDGSRAGGHGGRQDVQQGRAQDAPRPRRYLRRRLQRQVRTEVSLVMSIV